MRFVSIPIGASVILLALAFAGATPVSAEIRCIRQCQAELVPVRGRFCRRWRCQRVCWHAEPQRRYAQGWQWENAAPRRDDDDEPSEYSGTSRANQDWTYSGTYTDPTPKTAVRLPALPKIPQEPIAIFVLVAGGILLSRVINWGKAIWQERHLDRIHSRTISARALTQQLQHDAQQADAMIRSLSREAFRRGTNF